MGEIVVETCYGKLRGKTLKDIDGGEFYAFQGVPYAKPPLGKLRFKAPQPPERWTDIRDATKESHECYQRHTMFKTLIGSEDCLYLNVYTPDLPNVVKKELKPVMVWIHGGGFTGGFGNKEPYGPEILITEDVVVVTINYRVGVLGFLSLEDPELDVQGNAGLKDMVRALEWVQENIENFNGDPKNVTIFGESAGGASVHLLMLSPLSKGLFHKAIAQSGCALNHWSITESSASKLCEIFGILDKRNSEILDFLQNLPIEELHKGQETLQQIYGASRNRPIGPVIEKSHPRAFLSEDPSKLLEGGRFHKVPLLIGYNNREGIFFDMVEDRLKETMLVTDFETVVPKSFGLERGGEKSKEVAKRIKEFYYGDDEVTFENKDKYYQLQTDYVFLRGIYESVRVHKKISPGIPVYLYRFSVDTEMNFFKALGRLQAAGASHADELSYQFKTFLTPDEIDTTTVEGRTIYRMKKLWANFAKRGDPNDAVNDVLIPVIWEEVKGDKLNFLDIGKELVCDVDPDFERIAFWEQIYDEYGN